MGTMVPLRGTIVPLDRESTRGLEGGAQCAPHRRSSSCNTARRARNNAENSALSCLYFWRVLSTLRGSVML